MARGKLSNEAKMRKLILTFCVQRLS